MRLELSNKTKWIRRRLIACAILVILTAPIFWTQNKPARPLAPSFAENHCAIRKAAAAGLRRGSTSRSYTPSAFAPGSAQIDARPPDYPDETSAGQCPREQSVCPPDRKSVV